MSKTTLTPTRRSATGKRRPPPARIRCAARRPQPRRVALSQRLFAALERWFWRGVAQFWEGLAHKPLLFLSLFVVWTLVLWLGFAHLFRVWPAALVAPVPAGTSARPTPPPVSSVASKVPVLYQGDPGIGWDSPQQYQTWWQSACAPAALTEVLRAWGTQVGIGPVLDRLWNLHAISAEGGLLHAEALATVAEQYGYRATLAWQWSQAQVAQITSQGIPVLVLLVDARQQTPYPAFVSGHWLVVVSSSASQVKVRDSSGYHIHTLTPSLFHTLFTGVAVVVWRGTLSLP